jgi:deoxyhypusine synthase
MTRFPKITLEAITTISIAEKPRKVELDTLATPLEPQQLVAFAKFLDTLPDILKARDLKQFCQRLATMRANGRQVAIMLGGHVIKTGLAPLLIDLMESKLVTSIAMNSAAAIHDCESALFGRTSEDVETNIQDGTFGMARETGEFINGTLAKYYEEHEVGYGEALGAELLNLSAANRAISVLAKAVELEIPVTVHAAIGTDIVHQQPSMRGDVTGEMSFRDFRLFATICGKLEGGAAINVGSSVIMPEVFLKAVTIARNLGIGGRQLTTANFDMLQHYRTQMNVLERPTRPDGNYYSFTGHHELMIPLFAATYKYYAHSL